jgi:branched-chain amino acid aminotransferase
MLHILINDKIILEQKALIFVKDRGFRFGDGIFETCLIKDGAVYDFEAHLKRLEDGLKAIKIDRMVVWNDKRAVHDSKEVAFYKILQKLSYQLIQKNKIKNGYLRIAISRGVGSIGYLPQKNIKPTLVIETLPLNPKPKAPIKLCISNHTKPSIKSLPVNYKLMNGLNSTLAKLEAEEKNCFDAIMLNDKNQICETSSANIFWVKDDILYTPHQDCGCLFGTIREKILQLSPIKNKLVKTKLSDLLNADEAFITNTAIGVLAVDEINKTIFKNNKYSKIFGDLLNEDIKKYVKKTKN